MVIYFFVEHNCDEAGSKRKADSRSLSVNKHDNNDGCLDDFDSDEIIQHLLTLLKHLTGLVLTSH